MKKEHIPYIFLIVLTIVLIVLTFRVKRLEDDLRVYKVNVSSKLDDIRMDISLIYKNVEDRMKKDASLFSNVKYIVGQPTQSGTVPVAFEILPKTLTDDMEMTLTVGDSAVILRRIGDTFNGTIDVSLFDDSNKPLVTVISSAKKTEYLEDVNLSHIYRKLLPELSAEMAGGSTYSHNLKKLSVDHTFTLNNSHPDSDVSFVKYTLIEEINGKELSRQDITQKLISANGSYFEEYKKSYDVNVGDTLVIFVEAEDSLGYIHKTVAYHWQQNDSGATADVYYHGEAILDKEGNLLVDNGHLWN